MILERFTSWRRERRIRRLCREAIRLQRIDPMASRSTFLRMSLEIEKRTPQQVVRMERDRNLERRRQG